jgi:methyl-accepting chemotaxis protein
MKEKTKASAERRRNYFIEKSFQARFILKFCILVVFAGLLTIAALYIMGLGSTTVSIVNSRVVVKSTADFLLPVLIQTLLVVMVLAGAATILVTLFVSHQIAGPLYRLRKAMEQLSEGDFKVEIKLRSNDQLKELVDTFNTMVRKLKAKL